MTQEHERSVGGSQSEWPTVGALIRATGVAAATIAEIAEGLTTDADCMNENIDATRGTIYAEKAMMLLASVMGRDRAHLLEQATRDSISKKRQLADVLAEMPEVTKHLDRTALQQLTPAAKYLGSAELFRQRLLQSPPNSKKD